MDVPVACGGVRILPGDYIFGDVDGVVVIPKAAAPRRSAWASRRSRPRTAPGTCWPPASASRRCSTSWACSEPGVAWARRGVAPKGLAAG